MYRICIRCLCYEKKYLYLFFYRTDETVAKIKITVMIVEKMWVIFVKKLIICKNQL